MPNIRQIRKREGKRKTRKWDPEAMALALQEVEDGKATVRKAAKKYGVPKSSLCDRVSGRVPPLCVHGQKQLLDPEDENIVVEYCLYCAGHGFPLTKSQVLAHALAVYNHRHPDAQKTALGQTWWINFRERHHHRLTIETTDIIDRGRSTCAKRGDVEEYFRLLTSTVEEYRLRNKPYQIYNCDEIEFELSSKKRTCPKGSKHSYSKPQNTKDLITVLACFSAAGEDVPPFVIYEGQNPGHPFNNEGVPSAVYETSQTGNMSCEIFKKWFKHFLKYAVQERPLLLVLDDHQSHLDPEFFQMAEKEAVILLCVPPFTSHILQPLEVSFFGPLKADFSSFKRDMSGGSHSCSVHKEFSGFLKDSYQRLKDQRVLFDGFKTSGLYPPDASTIDLSQFKASVQRRRTPSSPPQTGPWAMSHDILAYQCPLSPSHACSPPSSPSSPISSEAS